MNFLDRVVTWTALLVLIAFFAFLLAVIAAQHASADQHQGEVTPFHKPGDPGHWFDSNCCSGIDCRVYTQDMVEETPAGWRVEGRDEIIPYNSHGIRNSPPEAGGDYGLCTETKQDSEFRFVWDANHELICFYVPPRGF